MNSLETIVITAPKNVGHNKWMLFGHNNVKQSDDYLSAIQLRKQTKLVKEYWSEVCGKEELVNNPMNSINQALEIMGQIGRKNVDLGFNFENLAIKEYGKNKLGLVI